MKCPHCGAWNTAYLPKCSRCGMPLDNNTQKQLSWEESMHKKNHSLTVMQFDEEDEGMPAAMDAGVSEDNAFDPEALNRTELTDEIEGLKQRREEGVRRIEQMKEHAGRVRRSLSEAQIIRPLPEEGDSPSAYDGDSIVIRRRQQAHQARYSAELQEDDVQETAYD